VLPEGRRRRGLEAAAHAIFDDVFDGRIPPFDEKAAEPMPDFLPPANARASRQRPRTCW
jgi:hypothetical protein